MLITKTSTNTYAQREAGGKGYNLYLLTKENFPVPDWIIIGADSFEKFKSFNNLNDKINKLLKPLRESSTSKNYAASISKSINKIIIDTPFDPNVLVEIKKAYKTLQSKIIAVRSSALEEDSRTYSFAGQFDSYLFIKNQADILLAIKKCWASTYSERNISYRIQNKLALVSEKIKIAIVLQQMIDADKSGVLFTCDPIKKDSSKIVINSVYGIGEGLVSGKLDSDTFILDKNTLQIVDEQVVSKTTKITSHTKISGITEVPVNKVKQFISTLTHEELRTLTRMALLIEKLYRFPQDIEWAIKDGKCYLLQSRPVSTEVNNEDGVLNIWDNSNIIESYGGITLPLTFTFARYVYHQVYVQFCEILMVPPKKIREMDYFLKNMLGLFNGRVYYNLLNWYKLTSILPGYKYNRSFMETMMGTNESLEAEIANRIRPPVSQNKFIKLFTGLKFLYYHFVIQKKIDEFLRYFNSIYDRYRKLDYSKMTADEILIVYHELENSLLHEWKAPIINDYLCMVHFGILNKLTKRWLNNLGDSLQNDLLCGQGNLESTEPTKELMRIAIEVKDTKKLKQLIIDTPAEDAMEALSQSPFQDFKKRIDQYINLYGYRCMNEMKLEQKDLYQDPSFLFVCLQNYLQSSTLDLEELDKREREIRIKAENKVNKYLKGLKKIIYFWSLKNARKAVRNRENTRFCRTRIYGVVRSWFYNIGRDYTIRSIVNQPEDIFYLELNEFLGTLEGTLTIQNLKSLIDLRKKEYKSYEDIELPNRFQTRGPVYWMNNSSNQTSITDEGTKLTNGALKGTGCCPGVVEGKVKVVFSSKDNLQLNGEILVATRTDPGWIPLYPMITGLLVERGSLLSHSAIVAREMGIPTIVGIPDLTQKLKSGMVVRMNGQNGQIEVL